VVEQDDYEDDYEDELEYVEINSSSEKINDRKTLYMENDYSGQSDNQKNVNEIDQEKSKVKVAVMIFGRSTPVELDFTQIERS